MLRRAALAGLLALIAGLGLLPGSAVAAPRPNVVVVMSDDQDFRSLWAMPKLRRLVAARGTSFDLAVDNYPLCCPSRATFLTGQYAHNHGVLWNNFPQGGYGKLRGRETLPVWLRRAGYHTAHIGKYLNEYGERDPREVPPGWDDWHGGVDPSTYSYYGYTLNHNGRLRTYGRAAGDYQVDVVARLAEASIRSAARRRGPFFLSVAPIAPHTVSRTARQEGTPAVPAPRHAARFARARLPRLPNFDEPDLSDKPRFLQQAFPGLTPVDVAALTAHHRGRLGSLLAVDDLVERVVRALRATRELRDTVIVYLSDNGWILGEHRLRDPVTEDGRASGVKYLPYEGSSRIPLLMAGPGVPAGRRVRGLVSNVDVAATIVGLARARARVRLDGRSLLDAARRPGRLDGRAVLIRTAPNPRAPAYAAIRTARYRYERWETGDEGLYDLRRDPFELQSRHSQPAWAPLRRALARRLEGLRTCRGASCRRPVGRLPAPPSSRGG